MRIKDKMQINVKRVQCIKNSLPCGNGLCLNTFYFYFIQRNTIWQFFLSWLHHKCDKAINIIFLLKKYDLQIIVLKMNIAFKLQKIWFWLCNKIPISNFYVILIIIWFALQKHKRFMRRKSLLFRKEKTFHDIFQREYVTSH